MRDKACAVFITKLFLFQVLFDWMMKLGYRTSLYSLSTSFPRRPLEVEAGWSLQDIGITVDTVLNVEEKEQSSQFRNANQLFYMKSVFHEISYTLTLQDSRGFTLKSCHTLIELKAVNISVLISMEMYGHKVLEKDCFLHIIIRECAILQCTK